MRGIRKIGQDRPASSSATSGRLGLRRRGRGLIPKSRPAAPFQGLKRGRIHFVFRVSLMTINMQKAVNRPIALVTGANQGIGREVCRQLARRNLRVVLTGRQEQAAESAAAKLHEEGRPAGS
jgi:hypothetical protein